MLVLATKGETLFFSILMAFPNAPAIIRAVHVFHNNVKFASFAFFSSYVNEEYDNELYTSRLTC